MAETDSECLCCEVSRWSRRRHPYRVYRELGSLFGREKPDITCRNYQLRPDRVVRSILCGGIRMPFRSVFVAVVYLCGTGLVKSVRKLGPLPGLSSPGLVI